MRDIKGLNDLIDICDNIENASAEEVKEIATLTSNILSHINEFVERHGDEWVGCSEEYVLSFDYITDNAAVVLSKILYETEDYVVL